MAQRLSISEAPPAVLGAVGVDQVIPLVETAPGAVAVPKRTTLEALRAWIGGGGAATVPQIQRFEIAADINYPLANLRNIAPGDYSAQERIVVTDVNKKVLSGDMNAYTVANGNLRATVEGFYMINVNLRGQFITFQATTQANWQCSVVGIPAMTPQNIQGAIIIDYSNNQNSEYQLLNASIFVHLTANTEFALTFRFQNIVATRSTSIATTQFNILKSPVNGDTTFLISKLA